MMNRPKNRWSRALMLGFGVVLLQVVAFAMIGFWAWTDLITPSSTSAYIPMTNEARIVEDQLVYPLCSLAANTTASRFTVNATTMTSLRMIDLKTGRPRDISTPGSQIPQGF